MGLIDEKAKSKSPISICCGGNTETISQIYGHKV